VHDRQGTHRDPIVKQKSASQPESSRTVALPNLVPDRSVLFAFRFGSDVCALSQKFPEFFDGHPRIPNVFSLISVPMYCPTQKLTTGARARPGGRAQVGGPAPPGDWTSAARVIDMEK
jgi:hypothetical protein